MVDQVCPLCGKAASVDWKHPNPRLWFVNCPNCGEYNANGDFLDSCDTVVPKNRRFLLSFLTKQVTEKGEPLLLTAEHLQAWSAMRKPSPLETIDLILRHIESKLDSAGAVVQFGLSDYPRFCCKDPDEFVWLLEKGEEVGFLESGGHSSLYRLSLKGWQRVAELPKVLLRTGQAFVAMRFSDEMMQVYQEAMAPALEDCHWRPYNVLVPTDEKICDLILAEIRRSGLMVADFTDQRNSVYFEAGFARGLGIPVVSTCKAGQLDQLAFNTRQYKHLEWTDAADLRVQLTDHLRAGHPGPA
jgi:nucleoside 2-deoxyribosyltransferase